MPKPSKAQIREDVIGLIASFSQRPRETIKDAWVLRGTELDLRDVALTYLAMALRGYVKNYKQKATIKASEVKKAGLTVAGLVLLIQERIFGMKTAAMMTMWLLAAAAEGASGPVEWLEAHGVQVRNAFNGTQSEKEPASFNYVNPPLGDSFFRVDVAARVRPWEVITTTRAQLDFYPVLEWHRSTQASTEKNDLVMKGRTEVYLDLDRALERAAGPFFYADAGALHDAVADETKLNASVLASFYANRRWAPHNAIPDGAGRTRLFYYPSFGFEHVERAVPVAPGVTELRDLDASFAVLRLYLELYPWIGESESLQAVADYSYRWHAGGDEVGEDGFGALVASVNYYLDARQRFAVGYSYKSGRSPATRFVRETESSVGLVIKIRWMSEGRVGR